MATVYAALVSLMNVLTQYQHPTFPVSFDQSQIESMLNKVSSLVNFLEAYSKSVSKDFLRKMADAAFAAEDMIESYYVDQLLPRPAGNSSSFCPFSSCCLKIRDTAYDLLCDNLEKAIQGMDLIIQEAMLIKDQIGEKEKQPESSAHVGPVAPRSGPVKMVGVDEELHRLMDQLTSRRSGRQIIPIVGMGGIGKTTLARNLYEHPHIKRRFDIRYWVTISQEYTVGKIINSLLSNTYNETESTEELGDRLYKSLWGKRYIIVLDDIWEGLVWDEIRRFFPDNNNGSRILLTTRISHVAHSIGSCNPHELKLLDDKKSWDLLCDTVFGQDVCPDDQMIECGKKIAKGCKGLPLTIIVVGGLLKMSEKTSENWEHVAENVNSFINIENDDGQHCLDILSLSYNHLPIHLKPCFLYMATLREDSEVYVVDLIDLWVAEGLLKPHNNTTLEEVALEYLNHLVDRNLIMVQARAITGDINNCSLHDLLREFCLKEASSEQFLYQVNKDTPNAVERLGSERRLICHLHRSGISPFPSVTVARSLTCLYGTETESLLATPDLTYCRLLRVLNADSYVSLDTDISHVVNLRYLRCGVKDDSQFWCCPCLPFPRILLFGKLFWNLQTLHLSNGYGVSLVLSQEFWKLPYLRHMHTPYGEPIFLVDPKFARTTRVLDNLKVLEYIGNFNVSDEVIEKMPELKRLEMGYFWNFCPENLEKISCSFTNLACHHKLELLSCDFKMDQGNGMCVFNEPKNLTFSPNLRQLQLDGWHIPWEYMTVIGSLPKLEILELQFNAFCGDEWNSSEGDFQFLKYLCIQYCDLRIWRAESSCFPMLVRLELRGLELEEIPSGIGDVQSLQSVFLGTNKMSAVESAMAILDERQNQHGDNDDLFFEGYYRGTPDEKSAFDNLASNNFRLEFY